MKRFASQSTRGFTMMELIVVIAIISVLLALSMPVFASYADNARRDHDIACVKSAVAAAKTEFSYEYDGEDDTTHVYTYNVSSGEATPAKTTNGYGQWDQEADYSVDGVRVRGVAKDNFVTIGIKAGAVTVLHWGEHYSWQSVVSDLGSSSTNNWSENAALRESVLAVDGDERLQVDRQTIESFAEYFVGKTADQLKSELGTKYGNAIGSGGALLMHYRIDNNSNSVRLGYPAPGPGYLASIGYPTTTTSGVPVADVINNYMSQYLFVSDEMIEVGVEHSVNIQLTVKDGVCTACRVWVKNVDGLDSDVID